MARVTSVQAPFAHLVGPGKLKVVNRHLAFSAREQGPVRIDPRTLRSICCYGPVGVTDEAFQLLFRHGIQVAWMTPAGHRCQGRLASSDPGTTVVRLLQHQLFADLALRTELARHLIQLKIESQIEAARHYQRHGCSGVTPRLHRLRRLLTSCESMEGISQLRGVEGTASATWFEILSLLFQPPFPFVGRKRRPPTDPVNALLSLGYTFLSNRTVTLCEAAGLEVYLGALHDFRPGRPSLACDLIEPFRAPVVDRWALKLCKEGAVSPQDFLNGIEGVRLQDDVFPRMIHCWDDHWFNGGYEQQMRESVAGLVQWLRNQDRLGMDLSAPARE